ncbi:MAG TPA: hypothetical protein VIF81_01170 [Pyrinomonadaceae bacterium]|jgi:hypothetical protein
MKKTSKANRAASADDIARLADEGHDISAYFTNNGKMMSPVEMVDSVDSSEDNPDYFELLDQRLEAYQKNTRELMDRVHRRDLVYEFFFVFSRFEHALSLANYLIENTGGVSPDWNKFAREINDTFLAAVTPEVRKAVQYYQKAPPKKQIIDFDSLTWKDVVPETHYELEKLLLLIRRVRNNLFHGEKIGVLLEGDSSRDALLLQYGLTILYACLQSNRDIRRSFFSEAELTPEEEEEDEVAV